MSLWAKEQQVNRTENYSFGEARPYETRFNLPGELYRACLGEFGRCIGKVHIDKTNGETWHIGWVFLKRSNYEDTGEPYLVETWVTVHEGPDTVTRTEHVVRLN